LCFLKHVIFASSSTRIYYQTNLRPSQSTTKPIYNQTNLLPDESTTKLIYDQANLLPNQVRLAAASREALEQPPRKELPSTDASSNTYCHDDTVHDTCAACDPGESWRRGRRGCRLLACPCHLSTACRACFAVAQEGRAVAEEEEEEVVEVVFTRENRGGSAQHATRATPIRSSHGSKRA